MISAFVRRLQHFVELSARDVDVLSSVALSNQRKLPPRNDLLQEGDPPKELTVFLDGWGLRYKCLTDGRRQVLGYFLPGDLCDTDIGVSPAMDHAIATLTKATVVEISRDAMSELEDHHPNIIRAIQLSKAASEASFRETILNLGQRTAAERTAHFFCELFIRMKIISLTQDTSCKLSMKRVDIADAIGMTTIHFTRTVQGMQSIGLLNLEGKTLTIPDLERLKRVALFNPDYLYLRPEL